MNELTKTGNDVLESLRGVEIGNYKAAAIEQYLDFLKRTGLTLDTGLLPYVEALKTEGWIDRQGKSRKYKAASITARVAAAKALGNYVIEQYPNLLSAEQQLAFEKAKKAATKAAPKTQKGLDNDKYLPWPEVAKLIRGTEDMKMKLIMAVLAQTGARISEALNIKLSDMKRNSTHYHIHILGKGNKEGNVDIRIPIVEACLKVFQGKTWLFEHDGRQYNPRSVTTRIGDISEKVIGRRISAHVLRHSYATEHLERGTPLSKISRQLRHSSISTTADCYLHRQMPAEEAMLDIPDIAIDNGLVPADPEDEKKVSEALDKALKHLSE